MCICIEKYKVYANNNDLPVKSMIKFNFLLYFTVFIYFL